MVWSDQSVVSSDSLEDALEGDISEMGTVVGVDGSGYSIAFLPAVLLPSVCIGGCVQ